MNPELRYYLSVFFRRLPLFLLTSLSIASTMIALAVILPTVYSSKAVLLVESAQIPDELATSTVQSNASEQLEIVQRRLMTRANLIDIARQFDVFEDLSLMNPDQIVVRMTDNTNFKQTSGRDRATLLQISFDGRTPAISAEVTNEYVTRILAGNSRSRMQQAEDTLAFFEQEVDRLGTELDLQSARILKFQNENSGALPDSLDYRLSRQNILQERLSQFARDRSSLEDQRERFIRLFNDTGQSQTGAQVSKSSDEIQLDSLKEELSIAMLTYSDTSPQVRRLKAQVEALEDALRNKPKVEPDAPPTANATILDLQLAEIDAQLEFMGEQTNQIEQELAELEVSIRKTPNNSIALEALNRDYENVQEQYNSAIERLSAAVTGERIEVLSKGQRISVIEQAVAPNEPSSPNRPLIAAGGVVLGLSFGLGLIALLEMLNKAVRRPVDLTNGLGIVPLATVPYISTSGEKLRRRFLILLGLAAVLFGIPAILYFVHYSIVPLDLVLDRILERLKF